MTPFQTREKLKQYRFRPQNFSAEEERELEQYSRLYGFVKDDQAMELPDKVVNSGILSQFTSGLTEGALGPIAMGGWAEDPNDEFQHMAYSAGHLLGFALPMLGSVVTGGGSLALRLGAGASKIGLSKVGAGIGAVGKGAQAVGGVIKKTKSVPLYAGDLARDKARDIMAKAGWEAGKYLQKKGAPTLSAKLYDSAWQGAHLAVASGVSGLWNGVDDELDNLVFGMVSGGLFGGLGNFINTGKMLVHPNPKVSQAGKSKMWKYAEEAQEVLYKNQGAIVSGALGAGFQGGYAHLQGAPTVTQIYELILGGFFGATTHGVPQAQASKYFNKFNEKDEHGFKYDITDMRKMEKDDDYINMSPDAQDIVRKAFVNHVGEMWDKDIVNRTVDPENEESIGALWLSSRISRGYEKARDRKFKEADDIKSADPFEEAKLKAEALDVIPKRHKRQQATGWVVESVLRQVSASDKNNKPLDSKVQDLWDKLTPESKVEVRGGSVEPLEKAIIDYFRDIPDKKINVTVNDIKIAESKLIGDQREAVVAPFYMKFFNQMQKANTRHEPDAVLKHMIDSFKSIEETGLKDIPVEDLVNTYKESFAKSEFSDLTFTPEMEGTLVQLYTRLSQGRVTPYLSLNNKRGKVTKVRGWNLLKRKKTSREPKTGDEVMHQDIWGDKIQIIEFSEFMDTKGKNYVEYTPYDKVDGVPVMDGDAWTRIMQHLDRQGYYLKIPKKDGGVEKSYPIHPETSKMTFKKMIDQVYDKIQKKRKKGDFVISKGLLKKYIEKDYDVWLETMGLDPYLDSSGEYRNLHEKAFLSNYLYEKEWNFNKAIDRVKRESLISSRAFWQTSKESFKDLTGGTDEINMIIVDNESGHKSWLSKKLAKYLTTQQKEPETYWTRDKDGKPIEEAWGSKVDGWIVMHSDLYKQFIKSSGFSGTKMSHLKPSVAVKMPDGSLFLVKGGVHPSRLGYDKSMLKPNTMIMSTSAVKSFPTGTKVFTGQANKKGKYSIKDEAGKPWDGEASVKMNIEDFRVNFGVYGDNHSGKPVTIKKQMHSFFDAITMSNAGFRSFMDAIHDKVLNGTELSNAYVDALAKDPNAIKPDKFKITDISDTHFIDIINDIDHPLHKDLNLEIFNKIKHLETIEEFAGTQMYEAVRDYANNFETWYRSTGYHPLSGVINHNLYNQTVHLYRLNRFTKPEWRNSGSGWVAGVDPIMEAVTKGIKENATYEFYQDGKSNKLKVGHFKLGHSHGEMQIDWVANKRTTLKNAWNEYRNALKGLNPDGAKANITPQDIGQMRQQLLMAVMRVPANAISGTRGLLFDGFVDNDVAVNDTDTMADWGVYMRGRDHFYIDGADVDGDKTFFYQGLPHQYMNDLIKNDDFLERYEGKKAFLFENKAEKLNEDFLSTTSTALTEAKTGVKEIWSGFQDGADIGGIMAGLELKLKTKGHIPKGYRTDSGNKPKYKDYGAIENKSREYKDRTELNAKLTDGTVIFGDDMNSRGTKATLFYLKKHDKPVIMNPSPAELTKWAKRNNIERLNVAGNRSKDKGEVQKVLTDALGERKLAVSDYNYIHNNPLGQWSPGALRKAGQSSYEGKQGLGLVVNAKSFLNVALADIIQNKNGIVDLEVVDKFGRVEGYLKGKTSLEQLNSEKGYYVMGTEAHSRTADSASYFSMANAYQMTEIVFRSAFEKGLYFKSIDGYTEKASIQHLYNSRAYKHLSDLNRKLYGYDYQNMKPWSVQAVNEAVRGFKTAPDGISSITDIAHKMAQNEINTDPMRHINHNTLGKNISLVNQIMNNPKVLEYIARQNLQVRPLYYSIDYNAIYEQMERFKDFRAFESFTDTEGGRLKKMPDKVEDITKADRKPYIDFIWEGINKGFEKRLGQVGVDIQRVFDGMFTDARRGELGKNKDLPIMRYRYEQELAYKINDTMDIWSALVLENTGKKLKQSMTDAGLEVGEKGKTTSLPVADIVRIARQLNEGKDITLATDVRIVSKFAVEVDKARQEIAKNGVARIESRVENQWTSFRDIISQLAENTKIRFKDEFKKRDKPAFESQADAEDSISKSVQEISDRAKDLGIDPKIAVEYYYNHLLSSLSPQPTRKDTNAKHWDNRIELAKSRGQYSEAESLRHAKKEWSDNWENTNTPVFVWGLEAIPNSVKASFMKGYANAFDLLNTVKPKELRTELGKSFEKPKEEVKTGKVENKADSNEVNTLEIDRLLLTDDNGNIRPELGIKDMDKARLEMPKDMNRVFDEITKSLDTLPDGAILRFEDLYQFMKFEQGTKESSIKKATWDDIRSFNEFLKEIVHARQPDGVIKRFYHWIFPDTIGQKMAGHDLSMLYKMKIPVRTAKDMGLATIKVPVSSMTFMHKTGGLVREVEDSIKNNMVEGLFDSFQTKKELETLEGGITAFTDLFMLAMKEQNIAHRQNPKQKQFYIDEWKSSSKLRQKYENKKFKVSRDGKVVEVTSKEIINQIIAETQAYTEGLYRTFQSAGLINKKTGEWEKIDWSKIDETADWGGKGLKMHDYIIYDKQGRFDMQNFQKHIMDNVETFGVNKLRMLIGKEDNPLSVELFNRIQYETGLEEALLKRMKLTKNMDDKKLADRGYERIKDINSDEARNFRIEWRKDNPFIGLGRVEGYFPQMMHDRKLLRPWIDKQQTKLKAQLSNYIADLLSIGKRQNITQDEIPMRFRFSPFEIKMIKGDLPEKALESALDKIAMTPRNTSKEIADRIMSIKLEKQREGFEMQIGGKVANETAQSDFAVNYVNSNFREKEQNWKDIGSEHRPGTGRTRSDDPMPHFSYGFEVLEAFTNQWVGSFFKNMNALAFRKIIRNYEDNSPLDKESKDGWALQMKLLASSLLGKPNALPDKYVGLSKLEIASIKEAIRKAKKYKKTSSHSRYQIDYYQRKLKEDKIHKKKYGVASEWYNPFGSLEYKMSDKNIIDWLDTKSQGMDRWLIPGFSKRVHGTKEAPKLFGKELPVSERARKQVLHRIVNSVGSYEAKLQLISLLAHPKTGLGNILGGSANTITSTGFRNFKRAKDTTWLVNNVFNGAKLADGTPIKSRRDIHRWVAEIGAQESFYIDEATMDKRLDAKKLKPFIKELVSKDPDDGGFMKLAKKYQVEESVMSLGGYVMRKSERVLRTDSFIAHYLNAREQLTRIIPDMPFDHPYLTGMALKGVEATQFLYHNINRPAIGRSSMGKVMTRFQPFVWNSIRFRRELFKNAKRYGFRDKNSMDRAKRLMALDLTTMALANLFVGSIFDSIMPPPMNYVQETAEWLFGDERTSERAFFSSYPHTALAPLQVVTAPVHRYWLPLMTATINGEWNQVADYTVYTWSPFGRFARSLAMSLERPEMVGEFMFGIPIHKLGSKIRGKKKDDEV